MGICEGLFELHVGALLSATHSWYQAVGARVDVCTVFLDLSKAFDKVSHVMLLQKLAGLDIDAHLLAWLQDCLCNRSQHVVVNSVTCPSYFWCSTGLCSGPSPFSYLHQWGGWDTTELWLYVTVCRGHPIPLSNPHSVTTCYFHKISTLCRLGSLNITWTAPNASTRSFPSNVTHFCPSITWITLVNHWNLFLHLSTKEFGYLMTLAGLDTLWLSPKEPQSKLAWFTDFTPILTQKP